jgi:hypothetical protein
MTPTRIREHDLGSDFEIAPGGTHLCLTGSCGALACLSRLNMARGATRLQRGKPPGYTPSEGPMRPVFDRVYP